MAGNSTTTPLSINKKPTAVPNPLTKGRLTKPGQGSARFNVGPSKASVCNFVTATFTNSCFGSEQRLPPIIDQHTRRAQAVKCHPELTDSAVLCFDVVSDSMSTPQHNHCVIRMGPPCLSTRARLTKVETHEVIHHRM